MLAGVTCLQRLPQPAPRPGIAMKRLLRTVATIACLSALTPCQSPAWLPRNLMPHPASGGVSALAFDAARGRCVYYTLGRETWTYDGSAWILRSNQQGPSINHAAGGACYDVGRQVVVMIAGDHSTGLETWEWNGAAWSRRASGGLPARRDFAITYDAARGRVLLFGGHTGGNVGLADLWSWDGLSWMQIYNGGPTPRRGAAMTYDAARQSVVLFGGLGSLGGQVSVFFGDTWEWDGSHWLLRFGLPGPAARANASFSYDTVRQRGILTGGNPAMGTYTDTWEWDGAAWSQTVTNGAPRGLLAYDRVRQVTVAVSPLANTTSEYITSPSQPGNYSSFGVGCAGPNGVPQLDIAVGSTPRIGATLQLALSNLPQLIFNPAFGLLGFNATSWNGQPLPVSLAAFGMPGCQAWVEPTVTHVLPTLMGTAAWHLVLPMNQNFVGLEFFVQGAVLAPGSNAAGVVVSNAGHVRVGTP